MSDDVFTFNKNTKSSQKLLCSMKDIYYQELSPVIEFLLCLHSTLFILELN